MDYEKLLLEWKNSGKTNAEVSKIIYSSFPTKIFAGKEIIEYEIKNKIGNMCNVPISSIHIAGSAKTGFSLIKGTKFSPDSSDLDVAIVDEKYFMVLWSQCYLDSRGFEATRFSDKFNGNTRIPRSGKEIFEQYLCKGIISPKEMPSGPARAKILGDFERLSRSFKTHFNDISFYIYANETFFQEKQKTAIDYYWSEK